MVARTVRVREVGSSNLPAPTKIPVVSAQAVSNDGGFTLEPPFTKVLVPIWMALETLRDRRDPHVSVASSHLLLVPLHEEFGNWRCLRGCCTHAEHLPHIENYCNTVRIKGPAPSWANLGVKGSRLQTNISTLIEERRHICGNTSKLRRPKLAHKLLARLPTGCGRITILEAKSK